MTSSTLVTAVVAIAAALLVSSLVAVAIKGRAGTLRAANAGVQAPPGIELSASGPTIVHFSAVWCGPCASVRRVVDQVVATHPEIGHIEVDIDAHPDAARALSVLSLPTTFIFDTTGRQAYRVSGVPKAADLRTALDSVH